MPPLDFPDIPLSGDIYGSAGRSWRWDGGKWITTYTPASRSVALRENIVNVLDHGAKGDGVTNDTVAIQAVLDTYGGKAIVFIPDTGQPYMCDPLQIPSRTDLLLYGALKGRANLLAGLIRLVGVYNVTIRGHGTIDGNKAAQTYSGGEQLIGLIAFTCTHIRISGITIANAFHGCWGVIDCIDVVMDSVTTLGGNLANGFAKTQASGGRECRDCWFVNGLIDGTGNEDYAVCFYGGVTDSGISGSVVRNAGIGTTSTPPGIGILSDSGQPVACRDILIANNISHGNAGSGISCVNPAGGRQTGIIISNNRCYNNNKQADGGYGSSTIVVDHSTGVTVAGNQCSANGTNAASGFAGIFLGPNASHISVTDNQIFNTGQGGAAGAGIWISHANHIHVSGNYIYDDQPTPTMQYALIGQAGIHNVLTGNFLDRPVALTLAADTVMANTTDNNVILYGPDTRLATSLAQAYLNRVGAVRWFLGQDASAESTGDAGSDFVLAGVHDNGTPINYPAIKIARASGKVTLATYLNMPGLPTSPSGLIAGDVWRNGAVLNIV